MQSASTTGRPVCYYCGPSLTKRANAAVLVRPGCCCCCSWPARDQRADLSRSCAQIGAWQILCAGCPVDEAVRLVNSFGPFAVFRDASNVASDFRLTPEDCLRVRRALTNERATSS